MIAAERRNQAAADTLTVEVFRRKKQRPKLKVRRREDQNGVN